LEEVKVPKVEVEQSELDALKLKVEKASAEAALWKDKAAGRDKEFEALKASHQAELAKVAEAGARDKAFAGKGIDDGKVRRYFELDFEEQRQTKDGEADFGKWLSGLDGEKSPHLAPFLKPAAGQGQQQQGQGQQQQQGQNQQQQGQGQQQQTQRRDMPNTNKGAGAGQQGGVSFTPEQIASMTDEQFIAAMPALRASNPELAGMFVPGVTTLPPNTVAQA
jgi:hypothetical protein